MIILDTNVISELMQDGVTAPVARFVRLHSSRSLYTSAVCEAEIRYELERMSPGRRRDQLSAAFARFIETSFRDRVLAFDGLCAVGYAVFRSRREAAGRPITDPDAFIAGTALAHGAAVATRNVADFDGGGLEVINPWALG